MSDLKLYPLKFTPVLKDKIWGSTKINTILNKNIGDSTCCGESWEISGLENDESEVTNGFLAQNNLNELVEVYMDELVGQKVYQKFGNEFPLLIKFIDAMDDLSIQVHPDDVLSKERHNAYGKTEMWYIVQADPGASLINGFSEELSKETYIEMLDNKTLIESLNVETTNVGDVFFIPAGRVHAIGKGLLVAEIQQSSDVTYRIYDFDRLDKEGKGRELHTELAVDAIDFAKTINTKTNYQLKVNETVSLVDCTYFTTNIIDFDKLIHKDIQKLDSFVIYMCIDGEFTITAENLEPVSLKKGETVLVPAVLSFYELNPTLKSKVLEVFIK